MKFSAVVSLVLAGLMSPLVTVAAAQSGARDAGGFVEVEGTRLFVRSVGDGTTPLVVLHGGPGMSHDYLEHQLTPLLGDDYRLIYYDQRASGRSMGLEDTTRLTMAQFVEDLDAVRRAVGLERMNLLGHSFGGLLAMHYAAAYPSRVDKLLLIDSAPASWELAFPPYYRIMEGRRTAAEQRQLDALVGTSRSDPAAMEQYLRVFFRPYFHDPSLSDSLFLAIDEQWLANYNLASRLVWQDLGRYDIHDQLDRITAPTLVLHGAESIIAVEGARAIHDRIAGSHLIVLEQVGHLAYIEAPQAFRAAVKDFVR